MFLRPSAGRITSPFDPARKNPVHGRVQPHTGVDFGRDGSPDIIASADGVVTRARVMGGYGNCITIKHIIKGKNYETLYAHLKSFNVKINQKVKAGQLIAYRGNTGNSTAEHLHFSIFSPYYKEGLEYALDPLHYIVDEDIKSLQTLLNSIGYNLIVDGLRGSNTDKATRDFQKKNNLVVDGVAGRLTMTILQKAASTSENKTKLIPSTPATPTRPTQNRGDKMFNPTSPTLKKAFQDDLAQAVREKLVDNKWLVQLQQNKLSLDDAFALRVIIEQRRKK